MNEIEFESHYNHLKSRIDKLLIIKGNEYAEMDTDRLANFLQGALLLKTNRGRVAFYYLLKHFCSLEKITRDLDKGKEPSPEQLEEKCGDIICYTYLIYACLMDDISTSKKRSVGFVEGSRSDFPNRDDTRYPSEKDFSKNEDLLNFYNKQKEEDLLKYRPEKEPLLDTNDSITRSPQITAREKLNLDTNL